ncbi:MAG: arsenosugar biosynthesis radical SAM protein ArsS [Planctomycetota bacterium]|nr:arsenosugar biosynthesis radical SAM protein ArsS [Planctomycetota bacterium]
MTAHAQASPATEPHAGGSFDARVRQATGADLRAADLETVQVNIGLRCNLACRHCHVESSPARREEMDEATMDAVLRAARACGAKWLDITGGAPEMHPRFRPFVEAAAAQGLRVMVRTNLTILLQDGYAAFPAFFAAHRVHLVASLPCYLEANVDRQRGKSVYAESIEAIRRLNAAGYGTRPDLPLDLVFNPGGPALPPAQASLEADYRRELGQRFGIAFTRLICIANMPIGRFQDDLARQQRAGAYQELLETRFNAATVPALMCRHQISVRWDGTLFDCDFNLALNLPVRDGLPRHIRDFDPAALRARPIATAKHCFGCTAGSGSSCGGALA